MGDWWSALMLSAWVIFSAMHIADAIDRNTDACTEGGDHG